MACISSSNCPFKGQLKQSLSSTRILPLSYRPVSHCSHPRSKLCYRARRCLGGITSFRYSFPLCHENIRNFYMSAVYYRLPNFWHRPWVVLPSFIITYILFSTYHQTLLYTWTVICYSRESTYSSYPVWNKLPLRDLISPPPPRYKIPG